MKRAALTLGMGVAASVLLRRMRNEFLDAGELSAPTAATMYTAYAVHAASFVAVLRRTPRRRTHRRPLTVTVTGASLAVAGTTIALCGMAKFERASELTGTAQPKSLEVRGIYRISRNPQYAGYVLLLSGLSLIRPSPAASGLTAGLACAYVRWVRVEEAALRERFGAAYDRYLACTPRWLGLPSTWRSVSPRPRGTMHV